MVGTILAGGGRSVNNGNPVLSKKKAPLSRGLFKRRLLGFWVSMLPNSEIKYLSPICQSESTEKDFISRPSLFTTPTMNVYLWLTASFFQTYWSVSVGAKVARTA